MVQEEAFRFYTDALSFSESEVKGRKRYYIEGYAATGDVDLVKDLITENGLRSMLEQIKGRQLNVKLDLEHETFTADPDILPVGKVVDARVDEKGLWIKAELNPDSSRFERIWNSIKNGFIDAFSIAFNALKETTKTVGGEVVRLLDDLLLINIALTGNPVNPEARITKVMLKSLNALHEVNTVAEDDVKPKEGVVAEPAGEPAPTEPAGAPAAEDSGSEPSQEEPAGEPAGADVELKSELAELKSVNADLKSQLAELKAANKELADSFAEVKSRLAKAEELLAKPELKSIVEPAPPQEVAGEELSPLGLVSRV